MLALQHLFESVCVASGRATYLVFVIFLAHSLLGRRMTPKWRYALWMVVMVRLVLPWGPESSWSVFNFWPERPKMESPKAPVHFQTMEPEAVKPPPAEVAPAIRGPALKIPAPPKAPEAQRAEVAPFNSNNLWSVIWLSGVFLFATAVSCNSWRLSRRVRRMRELSNPAVRELLEECKRSLGIEKAVELLEAPEGTSPAVYGLQRTRLLLPASAATQFSEEQLRFIFLHELAHVKRRDLALNWLMIGLQIVHWFNPFIWGAFAKMRAEREAACDAMALECVGPVKRFSYGQTIIRLLETFSQPKPSPNLLGIAESKSQLELRLKEISTFRCQRKSTCLSVILVLAVGCAGLTDAKKDRAIQSDSKTSAVIRHLDSIRVNEFPTPMEKTLFDTLAELKNAIGDTNSQTSKVDFQVAVGAVDARRFRIKFDSPIHDLTLRQFLDAVVTVAKAPKDSLPLSLKYSIENGAVVFRPYSPDPEKFFTRVFRVDPNLFREGADRIPIVNNPMDNPLLTVDELKARDYTLRVLTNGTVALIKTVPNTNAVQIKVREFLAKAGATFPTNTPYRPGAEKAMFYDDRRGFLFAYTTIRELDIIARALNQLMVTAPEVRLMMQAVEFSDDQLKLLGREGILGGIVRTNGSMQPLVFGKTNAAFLGSLTEPQFQRLLREIEKTTGIDLIAAPAVATISGRQARLAVENSKPLSPQTPPPLPRSTAPDANPTPVPEGKEGI